MTGALTPREFAERALDGVLLWQPGRIIDIMVWLDPGDFRTPANATVYRYVRDMVADVMARVEWGVVEVPAPDGSGVVQVPTEAEEAFRTVTGIVDQLREMREQPALWANLDIESERHGRADAVAKHAAQHAGLLQRLDPVDRQVVDAVLPLAGYNAYAVPGVDPVSVFERITSSTELGDRSITAPFLHTLMATAPGSSTAQPEVYAQMVLESSIRREVQRSGMRVAQASEVNVRLSALLAAVDIALNDLDGAQQRWDAVTSIRAVGDTLGQPGTRPLRAVPQRADPDAAVSALNLVSSAPDEREIAAAEETVLAGVLVRPDTLGRLVDRLYPEDFADQELGNTFRAAIEVHAGAHTTGRRVDPVTVAWEQQRHVAQHGPGVDVERLMQIAERGPVGDLEYATDIVMRGRLARLTAEAAKSVQQAAQHPGLQPADVLHTTRLAYDAVRATAVRMSAGASIRTRLAGLDIEPDEQPAGASTGTSRSSAQVIQLRQRSADLRAALNSPFGTNVTGVRLDAEQVTWPETHSEPDAGPEADA